MITALNEIGNCWRVLTSHASGAVVKRKKGLNKAFYDLYNGFTEIYGFMDFRAENFTLTLENGRHISSNTRYKSFPVEVPIIFILFGSNDLGAPSTNCNDNGTCRFCFALSA